MNKRYILKSNEDIAELVKERNSVGNSSYAIYYRKEKNIKPKIAISISKHLGSSPKRNLEKRRVREVVRKDLLTDLNNFSILIVIKEKSIDLGFEDKEKILKQLIKQIKEKTKWKNDSRKYQRCF